MEIDELTGESAEAEDFSSAEVIELLEEAWTNEKFAPELLQNKNELVDCVLNQISYMEQNLENLPANDWRKGIHQLEVDRIRFLVSSYLRQRIEKIEAYCVDILIKEQERAEKNLPLYLSDAELEFAQNYKQGVDQHFARVTSSYPNLPLKDWREQPAIQPNLDSFVFVKAKTAIEGILIDASQNKSDGDVTDLVPGNQMIIAYRNIADLVKQNGAKLI